METQSSPSGLECCSKHRKHTGGIPSRVKGGKGGLHVRQRHGKRAEFSCSCKMQQDTILSDVLVRSVFVVKSLICCFLPAGDVSEIGMFVG